MDVFVIPLGRDRYELYCEQAIEADAAPVAAPSGMIGRVRQRVLDRLRAAEERRHGGPHEPAAGWFGRLNEKAMAWVAERIAEQRLLWNLQRESDATATYPDDMTFEQAHTLIQRTLRRDHDRHWRWIWIDGAAFLVTFIVLGPLFLLIPGIANLPALYFGFRTVGHWFSTRGASRGMHAVRWTGSASSALTELREAAALAPGARDARVTEIATRLRLQHLATFYERVAVEPA